MWYNDAIESIKEESGRYCVYKIGDSEALSCYEALADAQAYLGALEANVEDAKMNLRKPHGTQVKAIDGNRVSGYLVRFTSRDDPDLHGEYFTKDTNFWLSELSPIGKPIFLDQAFDGKFKSIPVGIIDFLKEDEVGIWIEGKLKERAEYEDMLRGWKDRKWLSDEQIKDSEIPLLAENIELAVKSFFGTGKAQWSSGALPQVVEIADDGHIESWPIIEGTGVFTPAEPNGTEIKLKSALEQLSEFIKTIPAPTSKDAQHIENKADNQQPVTNSRKSQKQGKNAMEILQKIMAMIQEYISAMGGEEESDAMAAAVVDELKADMPSDEEQKAMDEEEMVKAIAEKAYKLADAKLAKKQAALSALDKIRAEKIKAIERNAQPVDTFGSGGMKNSEYGGKRQSQVSVSDRFPHWDAEDYVFALMLDKQIRAKGKQGILNRAGDEEAFLREFAAKATRPNAGKNFTSSHSGQKAIHAIKANELSQSTLANFGDEWVPDLWDSNLWYKARIDTVGLPQFRVVEMPSNPYELPLEGTDSTMYFVSETASENQLTLADSNSPIPDSKIGSGKVQLSAKKFGTRVGFSAELEEDSIIPVLNIYRTQAETAFMEGIDDVIFNGDTETGSTNINSDGSALAATSRYLALNGLRKDTFTNSTNQIDALGASPTLAMIRRARFLLARTVSGKLPGMRIFVNPETEGKLLSLDEFITVDKAGASATAQTGVIGFIDRIPVLVTDQIPLTDSDGKVTAAGNVVNRGTLFMAYAPHFVVGFRRRLASSLDFLPYYDAYQLTMTARMDFKPRDTDSVAAIINIGIG
jgi:hypothetical protein